jgi:hypothetical protein
MDYVGVVMEFYVAGYYLMQTARKQDWMDKDNLLPEKIWSGSRHICPKIPDAWIFDWVNDSESIVNLKYARTQWNLSDDEFSVAQQEFDELLRLHDYEFPNVFMHHEVAAQALYKYFSSVPDLKLIGLAIPKSYVEDFIDRYRNRKYINENGVYKKIIQKEVCNYSPVGFDLLGWDGADYCSFLCSSMEGEIYRKYGVKYNSLGLISEYQQAERVSQAIINRDEIVEDGFWAPWLVFEIPIHT